MSCLTSRRIEWCQPHRATMNRSEARARNVKNTFWHVAQVSMLLPRVSSWGRAHVLYECGISRCSRLTCSPAIFLQGSTRRPVARATCHVSTSVPRYLRSGVLARRMTPHHSRYDHPFGRQNRKCLDRQKDRNTNSRAQFGFSDPSAKAPFKERTMLKHCPFFSPRF